MAGLIERGRAALITRQQAAAAPSGPLVFTRAADGETVTLTGKAWVGRTRFRVSDRDAGSRLIWSDRDYLVPCADLVILGGRYTPVTGDWFEETLPGPEGAQRFEVRPYADEPEVRYADPQRTIHRVHTKRVAPPE